MSHHSDAMTSLLEGPESLSFSEAGLGLKCSRSIAIREQNFCYLTLRQASVALMGLLTFTPKDVTWVELEWNMPRMPCCGGHMTALWLCSVSAGPCWFCTSDFFFEEASRKGSSVQGSNTTSICPREGGERPKSECLEYKDLPVGQGTAGSMHPILFSVEAPSLFWKKNWVCELQQQVPSSLQRIQK